MRKVGVPKKRAKASAFSANQSPPKADSRWACGRWNRRAQSCPELLSLRAHVPPVAGLRRGERRRQRRYSEFGENRFAGLAQAGSAAAFPFPHQHRRRQVLDRRADGFEQGDLALSAAPRRAADQARRGRRRRRRGRSRRPSGRARRRRPRSSPPPCRRKCARASAPRRRPRACASRRRRRGRDAGRPRARRRRPAAPPTASRRRRCRRRARRLRAA